MPYIAIKSFPKDEKTKKRVAERINRIFLEEWGCPPQAISVSIEEIEPSKWNDEVVKREIEPNMDKMMIIAGKSV